MHYMSLHTTTKRPKVKARKVCDDRLKHTLYINSKYTFCQFPYFFSRRNYDATDSASVSFQDITSNVIKATEV